MYSENKVKIIGLLLVLWLCVLVPFFGQNGDFKAGNNSRFQKVIIELLNPQDRLTEHKKWVAVTLNLTLGMFGVHRLYLGTSPKVPVIYTFTLGGGGVLIIGDLIAILSAKELDKFVNDPNLIMWGGEE
jgi:hypothetical protein